MGNRVLLILLRENFQSDKGDQKSIGVVSVLFCLMVDSEVNVNKRSFGQLFGEINVMLILF